MGAHAAPLVRPCPPPHSTPPLLLTLLIVFSGAVVSFDSPDSDALLKFKNSLGDVNDLASWNPSTSPCSGDYASWNGVMCFSGNVWGLQLENMNLTGEIDLDSLVPLRSLRTLSFMNNEFDGPMPDFRKLGPLKSLFLSNNQFGGEIPDDAFIGMASLKKVYMANNDFTGKIPTSLAKTPRLLELRLENNQFVGRIPDFQTGLKVFNVSNNRLEGPIPENLTNMNQSSFSGNKDLCGPPLESSCNSLSSPAEGKASPPNDPNPPDSPNNNSSPLRIAIVAIAGLIALVAIIMLVMVCLRSRSRSRQTPRLGRTYSSNNSTSCQVNRVEPASSVETSQNTTRKGEQGKLSFIRDDRQRFDLQDLLRASAEVLGSGSFGSSYKAVLMDGQAVVVKRFKQMSNVGREEFHEHMRRLGRLRHPNLLPLVAYYYRKEEKLLVFDYLQNRSLASHLHGKHTMGKGGLDWPTRLKIIKGVAKGLAYLHSELPSLILPHGHLKSSNVLLDKSFDPFLMDYTLVPVVNLGQAQQLLVAYKSPEYAQNGHTTKKTDVWSLGILILEILTGQFPASYLVPGSAADLSSWVQSIIREESTEVFDREMEFTKIGEGEMVKLLKIGVACCEEDLEIRLDLKEAVEKIEQLRGE
ncbi:unnamed protein product [Ilex paraguariensis]|uniref:Protein kinase domain-containing protein n=1 Tax=Ilex paraguariensis TaxID=185542 RepID=A0ABC8RMC3_9AQUA